MKRKGLEPYTWPNFFHTCIYEANFKQSLPECIILFYFHIDLEIKLSAHTAWQSTTGRDWVNQLIPTHARTRYPVVTGLDYPPYLHGLVEQKGFEPSVFWLQTRRFSQLSYCPVVDAWRDSNPLRSWLRHLDFSHTPKYHPALPCLVLRPQLLGWWIRIISQRVS